MNNRMNNIFCWVKKYMIIFQKCSQKNLDLPCFCYHENLSIAGNCRMCLVEINTSLKLVVACAMPMQGSSLEGKNEFKNYTISKFNCSKTLKIEQIITILNNVKNITNDLFFNNFVHQKAKGVFSGVIKQNDITQIVEPVINTVVTRFNKNVINNNEFFQFVIKRGYMDEEIYKQALINHNGFIYFEHSPLSTDWINMGVTNFTTKNRQVSDDYKIDLYKVGDINEFYNNKSYIIKEMFWLHWPKDILIQLIDNNGFVRIGSINYGWIDSDFKEAAIKYLNWMQGKGEIKGYYLVGDNINEIIVGINNNGTERFQVLVIGKNYEYDLQQRSIMNNEIVTGINNPSKSLVFPRSYYDISRQMIEEWNNEINIKD